LEQIAGVEYAQVLGLGLGAEGPAAAGLEDLQVLEPELEGQELAAVVEYAQIPEL
jgi:hypothetical protein